MRVRPYSPDDYATVAAFWPSHGWAAVPAVLLPPEGYVAEDETGQVIAAGWLYLAEQTPLGMMEYLVTRPGLAPQRAVRALQAIVAAIVTCAREFKVIALLATCRQPALVRLYQRAGFTPSDTGMTHLVQTLA